MVDFAIVIRPRRRSAALVALHPDEATEAVVDAALALRKPFLVVPCCASTAKMVI
jgi:hypothetical protein